MKKSYESDWVKTARKVPQKKQPEFMIDSYELWDSHPKRYSYLWIALLALGGVLYLAGNRPGYQFVMLTIIVFGLFTYWRYRELHHAWSKKYK